MNKVWWTLGLCAGLSLAACGEPGDDGDGNGNETSVCSGSYTGAVTGRVRFCSLEATKLSNGELQYSLQVEPESGSGTIEESHTLSVFVTGEPQKGTYDTTINQAIGTLVATDGNEYSLQRGLGEDHGSVLLTVDSVPAGQDVGAGVLYEGFGGKAQLKYVAPPGSSYTGEVNLTLTFTPQQ
ncbi:MAG TPA: hypothetical protein VLQ93_10125 [Myxococcaceae bacterium]|nr:hypothetical protein [Myxococcaceae bacterium]